MVRGEIELARHHAATHATPHILPVRIDFDGPLPYPLNAYLDAIQYATWKRAAGNAAAAPGTARRDGARHRDGAAAPGRGADRATRTCRRRMRRRCPSLAARSMSRIPGICPGLTDATALAVIRQPGQTLTIKGPRQMGKSSLLMRTVKAGVDIGKKVALLDFQLVDEKTKANADLFFRRFAASIAEQLELPDTVDELWDDGFSNPQNCTRYVERHILQPLDAAMRAGDRRDGLDLPHGFLQRFLRHAPELARPARQPAPPRLEEAGHRALHVHRAAVLHRETARVAVQRRRGPAAGGLRARRGPPPQRSAPAAARRQRDPPALHAHRRSPVPHAQGALRACQQLAILHARRAVRRQRARTPAPSATTCATTCFACNASRS